MENTSRGTNEGGLALKLEATCSTKMPVYFHQKTELFTATALGTLNPTKLISKTRHEGYM
jgi:hypothetical protein